MSVHEHSGSILKEKYNTLPIYFETNHVTSKRIVTQSHDQIEFDLCLFKEGNGGFLTKQSLVYVYQRLEFKRLKPQSQFVHLQSTILTIS